MSLTLYGNLTDGLDELVADGNRKCRKALTDGAAVSWDLSQTKVLSFAPDFCVPIP